MTADRHFDDVLAELSRYLDDPPLMDSPERLRLDQLIAEVGRLVALGHGGRRAEQTGRLDGEAPAAIRQPRRSSALAARGSRAAPDGC